MRIGPKYKICKRLGSSVFDKCQTQQYQLSETRSAKNRKRKRTQSDFGRQLIEKQRARYTYSADAVRH
jgi:ribosomal protein S4